MKNSGFQMQLSMTFGSIGILLLCLGIFEYIKVELNLGRNGYLLTIFGLIITSQYIYFLEMRAGISTRLIWIRIGLLILVLWIIYLLFLS